MKNKGNKIRFLLVYQGIVLKFKDVCFGFRNREDCLRRFLPSILLVPLTLNIRGNKGLIFDYKVHFILSMFYKRF